MTKLLMALPNAFSLGWLGSSSRLTDIAAGLQPRGWQTVLLTSMVAKSGTPSGAEIAFPGRIVRVPFHAGPWPMWLDIRGIRRLWLLGCNALGLKSLTADPERSWPVRLRRWLGQNNDACGGRPDLVWGVCTGLIDGLVAARALSGLFRCPFVVELQDPPRSSRGPYEERALRAALDACAAVITTSGAMAEHLRARYESCRDKTAAVYLSFEDADLAGHMPRKKAGETLAVLHAGRLHGGNERHARSLVYGLERAVQLDPAASERIALVLLGDGPGIEEAVKLGRELGLGRCVVGRTQVPPAQAREEMRRADVLAVIKYQDPAWNMQIPGKLFSYLPFGKPILGIMGECEAAEILRRSGLGVVVAHEDVDGIARVLLDLWRNRESLDHRFRPDRGYIAQFSRSSMAVKVDRILRGVLEGRGLA